MKEFLLLFRRPASDPAGISPKEMEALSKKWQEWVMGIKEKGNLGAGPTRLALEGKVLKSGGVITDGPFVEIKEILGGYLVVKAESLEEATTLAHGCPALDLGGSVEVRSFHEGA